MMTIRAIGWAEAWVDAHCPFVELGERDGEIVREIRKRAGQFSSRTPLRELVNLRGDVPRGEAGQGGSKPGDAGSALIAAVFTPWWILGALDQFRSGPWMHGIRRHVVFELIVLWTEGYGVLGLSRAPNATHPELDRLTWWVSYRPGEHILCCRLRRSLRW